MSEPVARASEPVVQLDGVNLALRGVPILSDVSLELAEDDYLAVLGPNGGGKTMLLRVILGLVQPDSGSVRVLGGPPRQPESPLTLQVQRRAQLGQRALQDVHAVGA